MFSSFTNADLANVTEQIDVATADGNGGGIGVCTGELAKAGNFTATTVTMTSDLNLASTFIMLPAAIVSRAGFIDRQVFLTPGSDTWAKPTGAKTLLVKAIGGGSSGSAGRNAATAAGGGGGGGGGYMEASIVASSIASGVGVTIGAGGAATANSDGAASNVGSASVFTSTVTANGGLAAGVSATGSGGVGGAGGGLGASSRQLVRSRSPRSPQPVGRGARQPWQGVTALQWVMLLRGRLGLVAERRRQRRRVVARSCLALVVVVVGRIRLSVRAGRASSWAELLAAQLREPTGQMAIPSEAEGEAPGGLQQPGRAAPVVGPVVVVGVAARSRARSVVAQAAAAWL